MTWTTPMPAREPGNIPLVPALLSAEFLTAVCFGGVVFILGVWYGLYLNLSHMHRMRLWAGKVAELQDRVKERASVGSSSAGRR